MEGYKTYIVAGLLILAGVLFSFGLLTSEVFQAILGLLLGTGMITLRSGVKSDTAKAVEEVKEEVVIAREVVTEEVKKVS